MSCSIPLPFDGGNRTIQCDKFNYIFLPYMFTIYIFLNDIFTYMLKKTNTERLYRNNCFVIDHL